MIYHIPTYNLFLVLHASLLQKYRLGKQSCKELTDNCKEGIIMDLHRTLQEFVHSARHGIVLHVSHFDTFNELAIC